MSAPLAASSRFSGAVTATSGRALVGLMLLAAGAMLAACGSKSVRQPAVLEPVEEPELRLTRAWRGGEGTDADGYDLGLTLAAEEDALFSADAKGRVYAVRPDDGELIWRADTEAAISGGPSADGDRVYVGTLDAEVIALSRADGSEVWRRPVANEVLAAPVADGRYVAVRTIDGRITVLAAEDGEQLWTSSRTVPPLTLRGLSPPLLVGPVVIYGMETGRLVAARAESGEPVWEQVVAVPSGRSELERMADIDAPLLLDGDKLYALSYGGEVAALNVFSGEVLWRRSIASYTGAAMSADRVYVTDVEGAVWALDKDNGAAAWKSEALRWRRPSAPVVHKGFVAVADFKGYVHYFTPADGRIIARSRPLSGRVDAQPRVVDGALMLSDVKGRIVALRAQPRD